MLFQNLLGMAFALILMQSQETPDNKLGIHYYLAEVVPVFYRKK